MRHEMEALTELLVEKGIITRNELLRKIETVKEKVLETDRMTNAERIIRAVAHLVRHQGQVIFSRKDIRAYIELSQQEWASGYTAVFQGMRVDHPGRAPRVGAAYRGVFRRVDRGQYVLTDYGKNLIEELDD